MTIRKQSLVQVISIVTGLIAVTYFISRLILLNGFIKLEKQATEKNVLVAKGVLSDKIKNLDTKISDWSNWDDSYKFIEDANADFIKSNLADRALVDLKIDFIIFINSAGDIVFSKGFDPDENHALPIPGSLKKYLTKRKENYPFEPNAGSIFKNPPNAKAGEIIDKLGLKGFKIGNAMISHQHANMIVNTGGAEMQDVAELIKYIQNKVYEKTGIKLEPEVIFLGDPAPSI